MTCTLCLPVKHRVLAYSKEKLRIKTLDCENFRCYSKRWIHDINLINSSGQVNVLYVKRRHKDL